MAASDVLLLSCAATGHSTQSSTALLNVSALVSYMRTGRCCSGVIDDSSNVMLVKQTVAVEPLVMQPTPPVTPAAAMTPALHFDERASQQHSFAAEARHDDTETRHDETISIAAPPNCEQATCQHAAICAAVQQQLTILLSNVLQGYMVTAADLKALQQCLVSFPVQHTVQVNIEQQSNEPADTLAAAACDAAKRGDVLQLKVIYPHRKLLDRIDMKTDLVCCRQKILHVMFLCEWTLIA